MIQTPMDALRQFPVRRTDKQKKAFRDAIQSYAQGLGYRSRTESGNVVIGDPETALYLVTAGLRSDSGAVTLLETAASMPANLRGRVCFVLFDGWRGLYFHRRRHVHAAALQTVLLLRRAGSGDNITFTPNKALRDDADQLNRLIELERRCGEKKVRVLDKGMPARICFPTGAVVSARSGKLPALRDCLPDYTNVNILRACLITYIGGAVE